MTIKHLGGIFGRNPEFNEVTIEGSIGASDHLSFDIDGSEAARISTGRHLLVGKTAQDSTNTVGFEAKNTGEVGATVDGSACAYFNRKTSDGDVCVFRKNNTTVGSISVTGSATAYNQSSDERLKENIQDADDAGDVIDAIQVRKFDWIADGKHQDYGVIAQELNAVVPDAVTMPEDTTEMAGVDYSKLVPMLVKEIQSLRARVAQLEGN
jgi:hypothetical protein